MTKEQLQKNATDYINQSLLLTSKEKQFWLKKLHSMPPSMLSHLITLFKRTNTLMENYLRAAVTHDPEHYLQELKQQWQKMSTAITKYTQQQDSNNAEKQLEENIQNLL